MNKNTFSQKYKKDCLLSRSSHKLTKRLDSFYSIKEVKILLRFHKSIVLYWTVNYLFF